MIIEGLVTTLNAEGSPHLAPMGTEVARPEFDSFILKPFKTSQTYRNLMRHPEGVFHITDDVLLLAKAAVGAVADSPEMQRTSAVRGYFLGGACRTFEFTVNNIDDRHDRVRMNCTVLHTIALRHFSGFNRAKHAVLEAAILATRFHLKPAAEIEAEFTRLRVIVDKTAGEQEFEAMAFLEHEWANFRGESR